MQILIVVNDPKDWPLDIDGVEVASARSYLADQRFAELTGARVFNLCRSYRYQSAGYYVSLLAEARGHRPMPAISTIQDFKSKTIVKIATEDLERNIQRSLAGLKSKEFTLSIYFGRNLAKKYDTLSQQFFRLFQAPFLRAFFIYHEKEKKWLLKTIAPIAARDIPQEHLDFVVTVAGDFFKKKRSVIRHKSKYRYDLAILQDPDEKEPPSDKRAIERFIRAANSLGIATELIEHEDYGRLAEFDALFIRTTTSVNHYTYRFARRAAAKKLVVVDDPESILKCTNKVFLAELMQKNKISAPRTMIVHSDNAAEGVHKLGLPCILKQPDSSFSQGVVKVETEEEYKKQVAKLLDRSDLIIAQEFLPTPFDWRVGVFDRKPIYVCKYFMAQKHWQIIKRDTGTRKTVYGNVETLAIDSAPPALIRTALKVSNLIGDGLYGVDIKQLDNKFHVIEVNDNPNIDAGFEDMIEKEQLYRNIMQIFLKRIEHAKGSALQTT